MVSLAELDAEELEAADFAAELAAQTAAASRLPSAPLLPANSPLNIVVAPIDAFAGRLASMLSGGRAR